MARPSKPKALHKQKVCISMDKGVYKRSRKAGLNISRFCNSAIRIYFENAVDETGRAVGNQTSNLHRASNLKKQFDLHELIFTREISDQRKKDLWKGAQKIFGKRAYNNSDELLERVQRKIGFINRNSKYVDALRLVLRQAMLMGLIEYGDYYRISSQVKPRRSRPDLFVPQDEEIRNTVSKLEEHHKLTYLLLLYSGIRVSEAQYLLDHKGELKTQEFGGFVKVTLDWSRGSKIALFAYLPIELYADIGKAQKDLAGLQARIKKLNLVPLKYCRKWFAQKCLEVEVKPEVIDFYQGRAPRTVLLNHYVNLQTFADVNYGKVVARINEVVA